jgi:Helicase conserved C-terminal domain
VERTLIETQQVVFRCVVRRGSQIFYPVKDVSPHRNIVVADLHMKAVVAAIDHVRDLLSRVVPILPLRVDAPDMGDVFPRTVRVKIQSARIRTAENEILFIKDASLLDDGREGGRFEFSHGEKTEALKEILGRNRKLGRRTVVFCRTIRLLEALKVQLAPLELTIFELTGEKRDAERAIAIQGLRKSEAGVLLMTRTTGGRGLDLPFVDCGLFYSPKTDPVQMWQEMSRIRSTVSAPKDTYILCYSGTPEPETLRSVVTDLAGRKLGIVPRWSRRPTTPVRAR